MIFSLLLLFLSFFIITSFPIISFAQQSDVQVPTIAQIPSVEEQAQLGFLIITTNIINDNGGTKEESDITLNMLGSQSFPSSFQASPSPHVQIISIQEGHYSISVDNAQGYKISFGNQCEGQIKAGDKKSCSITLDDSTTKKSTPEQLPIFPLSLPSLPNPAQNSGEERLTIAQIPSVEEEQSQLGFVILATNVINDNGGMKQAPNFKINILGSQSFPSSFQAASSHLMQVISIQEGQYSMSVDNAQGYKILFGNQCEGQITVGQIKTCLITLDDLSTTPPPQCPVGQHFDQITQQCVPDIPPPTGAVYPVPNIIWFYDSQPTLSKDMVLRGSQTHPTDRVLLSSSASGVSSHPIKNGWLEVQSGGGNGRVYWNYHEVPQFSQLPTAGFNTAMTGTFMFKPGIDNLSVKDGNHGTNGWVFDGELVFGGFGLAFHRTNVESKAEYWHNEQGNGITLSYPNGLKLVDNKEYKFFLTLVTDRVKQEVVLNAWLDFSDGKGWVQVMKDRKWGQSGWDPGNVPNGDDKAQIEKGPSFIKKHHVWTRANGDSFLPVKDIRIGALDFLS